MQSLKQLGVRTWFFHTLDYGFNRKCRKFNTKDITCLERKTGIAYMFDIICNSCGNATSLSQCWFSLLQTTSACLRTNTPTLATASLGRGQWTAGESARTFTSDIKVYLKWDGGVNIYPPLGLCSAWFWTVWHKSSQSWDKHGEIIK